jgi:hypothetical protein
MFPCYLLQRLPFALILTLQNQANIDADTLAILTYSLITKLLNLDLLVEKCWKAERYQQLLQTIIIFETSFCVAGGYCSDL